MMSKYQPEGGGGLMLQMPMNTQGLGATYLLTLHSSGDIAGGTRNLGPTSSLPSQQRSGSMIYSLGFHVQFTILVTAQPREASQSCAEAVGWFVDSITPKKARTANSRRDAFRNACCLVGMDILLLQKSE